MHADKKMAWFEDTIIMQRAVLKKDNGLILYGRQKLDAKSSDTKSDRKLVLFIDRKN